MARPKSEGDPRDAGGSIVGAASADPNADASVVIDTSRAVLLAHTTVALVDTNLPQPVIAMSLGGRINKTTDTIEILYLFDVDGAASMVSEIVGLATRIGPEFSEAFMARLDQLAADGAMGDEP